MGGLAIRRVLSIGGLVILLACAAPVFAHSHTPEPSVTLVLSTHQPIDSPYSQWLSKVYRELFARIGMNVEVRYVPAARSTVYAHTGEIDGQVGRVSSYQDRSHQLQVPEAIYPLEMIAFVRKPWPYPPLEGWDSLAGKQLRIEYMRGASLPQRRLQERIAAQHLSAVTSVKQGLSKLKAGRSDVFVASMLSAWPFVNSSEFNEDIVAAGVLERDAIYPYLDARHHALAPSLVKALQAMKREGLIEALRVQAYSQ
ncbi:substrate-binding periplasmic protein [Aliagarivorans marinus]|uniref:substrate-binding periplasmic protein n=1 Tax=Aliagarivorans marinus TaxID=561965 RepID=UPI0004287A93|nr:transporter substrate-binding domain-containing protein [Aliagarivorans marinus]